MKAVFNVTYIFKEGMREPFLQKLAQIGMAEKSRVEDGCITYEYFASIGDPDKLFLLEHWRDVEAQKAHTNTSHFAELAAVKDDYVLSTIIEQFSI